MSQPPTSTSPPSVPRRPRRARRLLFGCIVVPLTFVVSLVALEVGLRLFWSGFYPRDGHMVPEAHAAVAPALAKALSDLGWVPPREP